MSLLLLEGVTLQVPFEQKPGVAKMNFSIITSGCPTCYPPRSGHHDLHLASDKMCGSNRQRAILLASDQFSSTESTGHGRVKHTSTDWPRLSTLQESWNRCSVHGPRIFISAYPACQPKWSGLLKIDCISNLLNIFSVYCTRTNILTPATR